MCKIDKGLPTKDETSETIVRILYPLVPYIYDSLKLKTYYFFVKLLNKPFFKTKFKI